MSSGSKHTVPQGGIPCPFLKTMQGNSAEKEKISVLSSAHHSSFTIQHSRPSFAAEGFYRVSEGRADGLNTYRQQGNGEGGGAGHGEYPPADLRAIGKRSEPLVHGPPRGGEGDKRGDADKDREVLAEQADDAGDRGAEYLADADLLGALLSRIGNEAEKPNAGNEDGEDGEGDEYLACLLLGVIQFIKVAIHEGVSEEQPLFDGMELTFQLLYEARDIIRVEADGDAAPVKHVVHH